MIPTRSRFNGAVRGTIWAHTELSACLGDAMLRNRTEITIETREVWVIRRSGTVAVAWCPECGQQVGMVPPEEAASRTHVSARAIYRSVEAGSIHYLELSGGALLVCTNSICDLETEAP